MLTRKPIFDAVRTMLKRGFTTAEVNALDAAIDEAEGKAPIKSDAFSTALDIILRHEGGYVNHPSDPGGRTNMGVTQRTWEAWTGKPANERIMRGLTRADVTPLYRKNYWDAVQGDDLPGPLALCVFDFAVNAGPSRAAKLLQRVLGVAVDGKIGPNTIRASIGENVNGLVREYQNARRSFYRSLPTFKTFGKGWLRRVDEVEAAALKI